MKVLTDNKYYGQIADVIREQNGTNNTYTPPQMVRALKDLFYEEVEGVPPITFQGIGENLLDYRIDGASGGVGDRTKNLLKNNATSQTINGVTFTINSDKSITCNGTATANTIFRIVQTPDFPDNEDMLLTGCPVGGSSSTYQLQYSNNRDKAFQDLGNGIVIQKMDYNTYPNTYVQIRIVEGYTCNNLTFYPMIRLASIEDNTYEPYGYKVPVVINGKNLLDFENPSIKSFNIEKISNGIYQANTNNVFLANRWALDTEAGVQYRISGTTNNSGITIQLSDFINGTSSPQGGQIRADGSINLTFTATGKTTLSIYSRLANQSFTATNFQIYKSSIADTSYEPYIEETTNIYLDEPIEENESISLSDTNTNIPTIRGTNVLSVDTTVQPSNVYVKARKESSYETAMRERYEEAQAQLDALESGGE